MKILLLFLVVVVCCFSCEKKRGFQKRDISKVKIEHIVEDSLLNVRAIELIEETGVYVFLTSKGGMGVISTDLGNEFEVPFKIYQLKIGKDSLFPNFRALAVNEKRGLGLAIGSPALLYNLDADEEKAKVLYKENHPKAFYDSMDFWNDKEGIAIGDSTNGCLSVIITRDGGNSWTKLTCDELPKGLKDEGAFAASDTNIAIVGDKTWVATTAGRVYYSPDKGQTWEVFDTPIIKDKETEGIYSIDFYDELSGFAIGGDYTKPDDNTANKIKTTDGGKTWQLVAENENPGYRSCVQYIPNRNGKELVAIGFKGIDYSNNAGESWEHLSNEGFYTIRFLNDSVAYAAGAGRISKLTFRE
ncbi:WD40/YVTN/BNR-like repeat-containing protein [Seonamhaeicola maritimus]|uniref:WD40/YVTN/BNR-like repeat-containing protein n=1 Tax=Seonamhaeicola maritimus TaxID=2591822 RepID=UPI0024954756|nr:oxidoreductase [Seonamhaeicola maritimus]